MQSLFHRHKFIFSSCYCCTVIRNFVIRSVEAKDSVFNGVTYAIVNATLSMQLMTFASLSSLLYERFRRLCELLLLPEGRFIAENDIFLAFIDALIIC